MKKISRKLVMHRRDGNDNKIFEVYDVTCKAKKLNDSVYYISINDIMKMYPDFKYFNTFSHNRWLAVDNKTGIYIVGARTKELLFSAFVNKKEAYDKLKSSDTYKKILKELKEGGVDVDD